MSGSVLLVDDHTLIRQALRRNLEEFGFTVVAEAADGPSAVAASLRYGPDLILMDVSMPGGDGITATKSIMRADARRRIIVLSMHSDSRTVREAITAGAVGYLPKSSTIDDVVNLMKQILSGDVSLSPEVARAMIDDVEALPAHDLSDRELEVLREVSHGCSTTEVAQRLFISQKTVKNHLAAIYAKLDARDRTEAVIKAVKRGVIDLSEDVD